MGKVLFVRADFDLASHYLSAHSLLLIDYARQQGYDIVDLYADSPRVTASTAKLPYHDCPEGEIWDNDLNKCVSFSDWHAKQQSDIVPETVGPARTLAFEEEILKKPDVFVGAGHGNPTLFTGQDLDVLIKKGVNDDACSGIKTYLWSCLTGRDLGPTMVTKTCPEFFGYREDWTFMFHPDYTETPLSDPYAFGFFDSGLATGYALLLGKSPQEVYDLTIERYNYWYDYWLKSEDEMADDIVTWLNWNRHNFVAYAPGEVYAEPVGFDLKSLILPLGAVGLLALFFLST